MLVTCPETAHLELLEYEDTPLGMLVTACTRFAPSCAVDCDRVCTARLDRRRRMQAANDQRRATEDDIDTLVAIRL